MKRPRKQVPEIAVILSTFLLFNSALFALDKKYAPVVNTALADLKKHSKLALLQGHVAINISSGSAELDAQFAEAIQNAYPNFASKADSVTREDLYQMAVKVYRENNEARVSIIVTNYKQDKIADRNVKVKNISANVMETLQYKTAVATKNEFEAYLNAAFADVGGVVEDVRIIDYINIGLDFIDKEEYDKAINEFKKEIETGGRKAEAYYYSAVVYYNKGNNDHAIADCTRAIRLDPNYAWAYIIRGNAYDDKGNYNKAIADFTCAIQADPNDALAYYNRGIAYANKGNYNKAIADYTHAIRLDPNYVNAYNNRGNAYANKGNYDQAISDYTHAIRLDPNHVNAYISRGIAYKNKRDKTRARADWNKVLQIQPNNANVRKWFENLGR